MENQEKLDPSSVPTAEEIAARDALKDEVFGEDAPASRIEILGSEGVIEPTPDLTPDLKPDLKPEGDDPTAGMDPAAKERYEAMEAKVKAGEISEQRIKSLEGRVEKNHLDLSAQREVDEKIKKDAEETERAKAAAPTEEDVAAAAKSEESWDELKKEFPEIVDGIEGQFRLREKELTDKIAEATASQGDNGAVITKLQQELVEIKETAELDKLTDKHKDWPKVIETDDWKQWVVIQSPEDQAIIAHSKNSVELTKVFDDFKDREVSGGDPVPKTAAEIAEEKRIRLAESETPIGTGVRQTGARALNDLTEGEYREVAKREAFPELYKK